MCLEWRGEGRLFQFGRVGKFTEWSDVIGNFRILCAVKAVFLLVKMVSARQSEDGFPVVQVPETAHSRRITTN
jgi:hypothetical protein